MTDTDRMVVWLREAMDAAQRDAEAADWSEWSVEDLRLIDQRDGKLVETGREPGTLLIGNGLRIASGVPAALAHVARQDPAAVLRRIAADRKLLDECVAAFDWDNWGAASLAETAIRNLAEGYGWTEETT